MSVVTAPLRHALGVLIPLLLLPALAQAQAIAEGEVGRVQIIHNAPDPAAALVDIAISDDGTPVMTFDDVAFRSATAFFDLVPGTYDVTITDETDPGIVIIEQSVGVLSGETYQLIATGVADPDQFQANPNGEDIAAALVTNSTARETSNLPGGVRFNFNHGVTDLPRLDVVSTPDDVLIANNIGYREFTNYAGAPADTYVLEVTNSTGLMTFGTFVADFDDFGGQALSLFASGFATTDDEDDTNGEPSSFGLLAVLPDGTTFLLPAVGETRLQIIHNAPDPAFGEVDVYVNGALFEDDLAFRTATPFDTVNANVELEVAVAPGTSTGPEDAIFTETYTLDAKLNYQLIATGVGEGDFEANPDGNDIDFTLLVNDAAQLESDTDDTNSDLNFVHGTPDAPTIDVRTGVTQDVIIFNDVAYGELDGYQPFPPESQTLEVTTADGVTSVAMFDVDLTGRIDEAGTILASGFLTPDNEDTTNGTPPSFGLLVVFADGSETFVEPMSVSNEDGTALPTAFALRGAYPNPFATSTTVRYDLPADAQVGLEVYDVLGRRVLTMEPQPVAAGANRTVTVKAALPSGTYLYRLTAAGAAETSVETGRMTVVR